VRANFERVTLRLVGGYARVPVLVKTLKVKKPRDENRPGARYITKLYDDGDVLHILDWHSLGDIGWRGTEKPTIEMTVMSAQTPEPHKVTVTGCLVEQITTLWDEDDEDMPWCGQRVILRKEATQGKMHRNVFELIDQHGAVLQSPQEKQQ
jgi:hypothetical protein